MNSEISALLSEIFTFPIMKLDKVYSRLFGGHAISTAEFRDKLHRLNGALQADFESRTQIEKSVMLEGRLKGYEEGVYAKGMALVAEVSEMNRIVREELEASNSALQKEKQEALAQLHPLKERMEELEIQLFSQRLVKDAYFAAVLRAAQEERSREENKQEASGLVEIMLLREEMNILQKSRARVERQLEASLVENELLNRLRNILETQEVVSKVTAESCLRGALGAADEEIISLNSTNESLIKDMANMEVELRMEVEAMAPLRSKLRDMDAEVEYYRSLQGPPSGFEDDVNGGAALSVKARLGIEHMDIPTLRINLQARTVELMHAQHKCGQLEAKLQGHGTDEQQSKAAADSRGDRDPATEEMDLQAERESNSELRERVQQLEREAAAREEELQSARHQRDELQTEMQVMEDQMADIGGPSWMNPSKRKENRRSVRFDEDALEVHEL